MSGVVFDCKFIKLFPISQILFINFFCLTIRKTRCYRTLAFCQKQINSMAFCYLNITDYQHLTTISPILMASSETSATFADNRLLKKGFQHESGNVKHQAFLFRLILYKQLLVFFSEDRKMHIAFGVFPEIYHQRVGIANRSVQAVYSCIQMGVERGVVHQ